MAYGYGQNAPAHAPEGAPEARLAFGAVRTGADAASIEVTAGLDLYYDGDGRHLHRSLHRPGLAGPGELIPSWETAAGAAGEGGAVRLRPPAAARRRTERAGASQPPSEEGRTGRAPVRLPAGRTRMVA